MQAHLFCFGLGYSATALGRRLLKEGWTVSGTVREPEKAVSLRAQGFIVHLFDENHPLPESAFADASHVLISVPPDATGDPVLHAFEIGLAHIAVRWHWLGYLSTTAVYGDRGGGWVDEETPLQPASERARHRVAAERNWQDFAARTGAPLHIFRLAGIYGPGRNALASLRNGTARRIDKPGQVFSRIHVDDLATVLSASMTHPHAGAIYNVCDDQAAPQHEVVSYAAKLLGIAPPPLEPFGEAAKTMSAMARSFYAESKRVRNDKMKRELGVTLRYPAYREGLAQLLETA